MLITMAMRFILGCAALTAAIAWAVQTGVVLRNEELRAEPYSDAKVLAPLAKDTRVEVLQQQGPWSLVKVAGKQGWVRSLNLRTGVADTGPAPGVLALESGRSGRGNAVATLGIRGINSKPGAAKPAALQTLENIAASADAARAPAFGASKMEFRLEEDPLELSLQSAQAGHVYVLRADAARAPAFGASKMEFRLEEDPLELSLQSAQAGHVYVLRADAAGESLELVFPNRVDGDNAVQAAQKLTLPRAGWNLAAGSPGRSHILVVVSERPIELKFGDPDGAGRFERLPMSADNAYALQRKFAAAGYGAALLAISVIP